MFLSTALLVLASTSITFLAGPISNITDRAAQSAQDLSIYRSAVLLDDPSAPTRNLDAFREQTGAGGGKAVALQELTATLGIGVPEYVVEESGPDHEKIFRAAVRVGGSAYGDGRGRSKKEAEQQAAAQAWDELRTRYASAQAPDAAAGTAPA